MKLIIGLGNPGEKYIRTRHNIGFMTIDELVQQTKLGLWKIDLRFKASIIQNDLNNEKIILAKPQTFMNNSGLSVMAIVNYYKIPTKEILVIHDEIDLPLGKIRIQKERSSAGHKGVQSIIDQIKTNDFIRMRIGIRPTNEEMLLETEKFVLQKFTIKEEKIVQQTIKKAAELISTALEAGEYPV
ncbi:MAG: aminoacyl-tRNA hydrolase [bacterium]